VAVLPVAAVASPVSVAEEEVHSAVAAVSPVTAAAEEQEHAAASELAVAVAKEELCVAAVAAAADTAACFVGSCRGSPAAAPRVAGSGPADEAVFVPHDAEERLLVAQALAPVWDVSAPVSSDVPVRLESSPVQACVQAG
jgi:hypothetical protein